MIVNIAPPRSETKAPDWHAGYLRLLPSIRRHAQIKFRRVRPELRGELIAETIANSVAAYSRLVELGKEDVAFPSALARFAAAQVGAGRQVGGHLNCHDVTSRYAQIRGGFQVQRLDRFDDQNEVWKEVLIEDGRAGPAEIAVSRIDFAEWLRRLTARLRKIALALASGETTKGAAEKFGLSPARISQLREWLKKSWEAFQGEGVIGGQPQPVAA